jgi:hypothetical protein
VSRVSRLLSALDRSRQRLHALPGVVGTAVGVREGEPVAEIFVAGPGDDELERKISEIVDFDFVVVPGSEPADAQAPRLGTVGADAHGDRKE